MKIQNPLCALTIGAFTLTACVSQATPTIQTTKATQPQPKQTMSKSVVQNPATVQAISNEELMTQGVWQDPKTGLIWDRCSVGQTWDGTTCTGEALRLNWKDAKEYVARFANEQAKGGYTDWRLPTIQELSSIRYCDNGWHQKTKSVSELTAQGRIQKEVSQGVEMITIPANNGRTAQIPEKCAEHGSFEPKLNIEIFPNSKYDFYWSSSVWSSDLAHNIRGVNFSVGYGGAAFFAGDEYYVRAVRSE